MVPKLPLEEHEVVIVGGGPAGVTTALALARSSPGSARRMVILEKGVYPRDKYCAGAIGGRGDKLLARLGVKIDVPSVPIRGMSFRGTFGEQAERVGVIGRVIRRFEFDAALSAEARRLGVRIVEGATVKAVRRVGDAAEVETEGGIHRGRFVVGADGVGSVVRKAMGLSRGALHAQVLELDTEELPRDRPRDLLHFDASDLSFAGYYWDFPTVVGGRPMVCRGVYHLRTGAPSSSPADIHERLGSRLSAMGLDIDRYPNKRFAERGLAAGELLGDGPMLLAGEAAGIDPITGEGIAQAIEYGVMAGRFLAEVLRGEENVSRWTGRVARSRLGVDLRMRQRASHTFFGPSRLGLDRILSSRPEAIRAGSRHFGALDQSLLDLAQAGWCTASVYLGSLRRRWKTAAGVERRQAG